MNDILIKNARLKLKKKFKKNKLGGKGTMRRKIIKKCNITSTHMNLEEKEYIYNIDKINKNIININNEDNQVWNIYIKDYMYDICIDELSKKDFNKNINININNKMEIFNLYFKNKFLKSENNKLIFIKKYNYLKKKFSIRGYDFIMQRLYELIKIINKMEFKHSKNENTEDLNIKELFNILNLDKNTIPSKKELKIAYLKKSNEFHPDKHPNEIEKYSKLFSKINNTYKKLNEYYYKNNDNHLYI